VKGFRAALRRAGVALDPANVYQGDFKFESGRAAARSFLDRGLPVTALWCQNDLMAVGVLNVLQRAGVRIPQDLSLVGMDNISLAEMTVPALTTVTQPFEEMCRQAVELVVALRNGQAPLGPRVVVTPGLIARESSAPPRPSPPRRRA
jgi:DNA-binding LacI/PurR family transcriptional regulator